MTAYPEEAHGTLVCRGTPVAKHCPKEIVGLGVLNISLKNVLPYVSN